MNKTSPLECPTNSGDPIVLIIEYLIEETRSKSPMTSSLLRLARLAFVEDRAVQKSASEHTDWTRLKRRAS